MIINGSLQVLFALTGGRRPVKQDQILLDLASLPSRRREGGWLTIEQDIIDVGPRSALPLHVHVPYIEVGDVADLNSDF